MIGQYPPKGTRVGCDAAGAILYVSAGPVPAEIFVPALVTPFLRETFERQASAACGERVRIEEAREGSALFQGAFLRQYPPQGQRYRCGAPILVAVSDGGGAVREAAAPPAPVREAARPARTTRMDAEVPAPPLRPEVRPGLEAPDPAGPEVAPAEEPPMALPPVVAPAAAEPATAPAVVVSSTEAGEPARRDAATTPWWPWLLLLLGLAAAGAWALRRSDWRALAGWAPVGRTGERTPARAAVPAAVPPVVPHGVPLAGSPAPLGLTQGRPLASGVVAPPSPAAPSGAAAELPAVPVLADLIQPLDDILDWIAATPLAAAGAAALGGGRKIGSRDGGETLTALRDDIAAGLSRALLFELAPLIAEAWGQAKALPPGAGRNGEMAGETALGPHGVVITVYPDLTLKVGGIPLFRLDLRIELRLRLAQAAMLGGPSLEALRPGEIEAAATVHWCGASRDMMLRTSRFGAAAPITLRPPRLIPAAGPVTASP